MKIHEKIGPVSGKKLYSANKRLWFSNKEAAERQANIIKEREKDAKKTS